MRSNTKATLVLAALALAALAPTASAEPVPGDPCPNGDVRQQQGMAALPDCRALEMVSPPVKFNQYAIVPTLSLDGERVRFIALAGLAETPGLINPFGDYYVATRGAGGWSTQPTSPPADYFSISILTSRAWAPDYSRWNHVTATPDQQDFGIGLAFSAGLGRAHEPLSSPFQVIDPNIGDPAAIATSGLQGAPADLSQLYFEPGNRGTSLGSPITVSFLPGDPAPEGPETRKNVYLAQLDPDGAPSLELLARAGSGKVWGGNCGARLGGDAVPGSGVPEGNQRLRNQGAIAPDGSRSYFTTRPNQAASGPCNPAANPLRIMQRLEKPSGAQIAPLLQTECSEVPIACVNNAGGDDVYQGASLDGTKLYFATARPLAETDLDTENSGCSMEIGESSGCDLYLYDEALPKGERLTQVSEGLTGAGAKVLTSIPAISTDGSRAYFVAQGVLTNDQSPAGPQAAAGQPNLYLWDAASETTAFIGTLVSGDKPGGIGGVWGNAPRGAYAIPQLGQNEEGVEAGGDGHILLFHSKAPLTDDDSDTGHRDLFRYDATSDQLLRISKAAPGGEDNGGFDVAAIDGSSNKALGPDSAAQARRISEDGETIVFKTAEALLPGEAGGLTDSFLWRAGQLHRLPGTGDPDSQLEDVPTLSANGSTVAFTSYSQLLPQDGDTTIDVYVARVGGGFLIVDPFVCELGEVPAGVNCQKPEAPPTQLVGACAADCQNVIPLTKRQCPKGKRLASPRGKAKAKAKGKSRCVKRTKPNRKKGGRR